LIQEYSAHRIAPLSHRALYPYFPSEDQLVKPFGALIAFLPVDAGMAMVVQNRQ
jgi:hypothetical protein